LKGTEEVNTSNHFNDELKVKDRLFHIKPIKVLLFLEMSYLLVVRFD